MPMALEDEVLTSAAGGLSCFDDDQLTMQ